MNKIYELIFFFTVSFGEMLWEVHKQVPEPTEEGISISF